jgi:hypothetical protein
MPVLLAVTALRRRASAGQTALSYVLGYANSNDVSSRHWQRTCNQWVKGKSFDTFCPIGPVLCSPEVIGRFSTLCAAVWTGICLYAACSCQRAFLHTLCGRLDWDLPVCCVFLSSNNGVETPGGRLWGIPTRCASPPG